MRILSVESWSFSGFAPSLAPSRSRPAIRSHYRSITQSLLSLPLSFLPVDYFYRRGRRRHQQGTVAASVTICGGGCDGGRDHDGTSTGCWIDRCAANEVHECGPTQRLLGGRREYHQGRQARHHQGTRRSRCFESLQCYEYAVP